MTVPLLCASGEALPVADESFDLVFCDHGAMSFCEPSRILPEVARVLRVGGRLVFNHGRPAALACYDDEDDVRATTCRATTTTHALRLGKTARSTSTSPTASGSAAFRGQRVAIDDLVELVPPSGSKTTYDLVPIHWALRWPAGDLGTRKEAGSR